MGVEKFERKEKYSEKDLEELFEEAAKRGAVLAILHFAVQGPNKEAVKNALVDFTAKLTVEKGVLYCRGEIEEAIETAIEKENVYSTFSEVKILAEKFEVLLKIALKYGPGAVEILKPRKIVLETDEAQALLLDASEAIQEYARFVMEKIMGKEEFTRFAEHLKKRQESGKKMLEESEKT
jgi:hypothetical protein